MKWSYKTVHFELKKEGILGSGFLDESEIEKELNEYGLAGWELVSVLEVHDGMMAFFKQPFGAVRTAPPNNGTNAGNSDETYRQREIVVEDVEPGVAQESEETKKDRDEKDDGIGAIRIE